MKEGRRIYCTLDHANKRKELAERSPYQFWLEQVRQGSEGRIHERTRGPGRSSSGCGDCPGGSRSRIRR